MRRSVAVLASAAAIATVLSGCAVLPFLPTNPPSQSTHAPQVTPIAGDCWESTYSDMAAWASWDGDAPIPCSKRHQSYTFLIADLGDQFGDDWFDADGSMNSDVATTGSGTCDAALKADFGWTTDEPLVQIFFFIPTKTQVAAGARWVRCDVALTRIGSAIADPRVDNLPADIGDLKQRLTDSPEYFGLCTTVPDGSLGDGPYAAGAHYADCTDDPSWSRTAIVSDPAGDSTPYPGDDAMTAFFTRACGFDPNAGNWYLYLPDADTWASGDRSAECWVTGVEGGSRGGGMA